MRFTASTTVRRSSYVLRLVTIFRHKLIESKEYCFMRSCKIFTNAYGKRGDLTLCKVLKIGQFLPVSVQYMLCCLRIEVKKKESYGPIFITGYHSGLRRVRYLTVESSEVCLIRCSNGLHEIISCINLFLATQPVFVNEPITFIQWPYTLWLGI